MISKDRDCEKCRHHTAGGCESWECSFEKKDNEYEDNPDWKNHLMSRFMKKE